MTWHLEHGDCRAALAALPDGAFDVVITDPVWPNAPDGMFDVGDATALFAEAARQMPRLTRRLIVVLGCQSDPRFLAGVPAALPFVRACWLRYAVPMYRNPILNGSDVAYVFGSNRAAKGFVLLPGECTVNQPFPGDNRVSGHPCPRRVEHMAWLVKFFSNAGDVVGDPFCGSATTGVAALRLGRRFWGCEIDAGYVATARERLAAETSGSSLAAARTGQVAMFAKEGAPR